MNNRRGCGVLLLMCGCYPSVAFTSSSVKELDCRTGQFVGELLVERTGARKVKVVYEQLPGTVNLEEVAHSPRRETLKGKDRKSSRVEVTGALTDRCAAGGVNMLASFSPSGTTGFVEVEPVLEVEAPDAVAARRQDRAFEFEMKLRCCGVEGAGTFAIAVEDSGGANAVVVQPATIECSGDEQKTAIVRGMLSQEPARIRLSVEDRGTGAVCSVASRVDVGS